MDRPIPDEVRELCEEAGGESLLHGNLNIFALEPSKPDELSVATAADQLRSWGWPVPDELVLFADDGQGGFFGIWAPRDGGAKPIVVQLDEVFEDACLAIVGDDLASFLRGWGAYYALLFEEPEALREIAPNLPDDLASLDENGSDDEFYAILGWANPNLPDPRPSASERGITAEQVDEFARSDGR